MNVQRKHYDYDLLKNQWIYRLYWAERSKKAFGKNPHKAFLELFKEVLFKDLRIKSLNELIKIGFDGYAMGGLAVGETQNEMFKVLDDIKEYSRLKNLII